MHSNDLCMLNQQTINDGRKWSISMKSVWQHLSSFVEQRKPTNTHRERSPQEGIYQHCKWEAFEVEKIIKLWTDSSTRYGRFLFNGMAWLCFKLDIYISFEVNFGKTPSKWYGNLWPKVFAPLHHTHINCKWYWLWMYDVWYV